MTAHASPSSRPDSLLRGVGFALLAAVTFGITMPFVRRFGRGVGAAPTAALLYAGAALASLELSRASRGQEARVGFAHVPRLLLVALAGAVFAPLCLTWGLQRTDATSASLLLNFEAVFTVVLAWRIQHETIGIRVALALGAMAIGGGLLVVARARLGGGFGIGAIAIVLATLGWAVDNTLGRPLAELSPRQVVTWKGALGASFSLVLALLAKQPFPRALPLIGLLACGATGYGLSLRCYLHAQRRIGAARTGSIFAAAPFVGATAAWLMGDGRADVGSVGAGLFFALGVYLHLTEQHGHRHVHQPLEHEHAHRHDDGHHDHEHGLGLPTATAHSHRHRHDARTHEHAHSADVHHLHDHGHEKDRDHGHGHGHGHDDGHDDGHEHEHEHDDVNDGQGRS